MMDKELEALCLCATKNALYRKMDELMHQAKQTMVGIDFDDGALYEVNAFGDREPSEELGTWNMYTAWYTKEGSVYGEGYMLSCGQVCWRDAFEDSRAEEIWLEGKKIFVKRDGEWFYVENEE